MNRREEKGREEKTSMEGGRLLCSFEGEGGIDGLPSHSAIKKEIVVGSDLSHSTLPLFSACHLVNFINYDFYSERNKKNILSKRSFCNCNCNVIHMMYLHTSRHIDNIGKCRW